MSDSLKARTASALLWSFVDIVGLRGVQFVVGVLLARLLAPEEFGLIAMLTLFIAVSQTLLDSGLGAALIQRAELKPRDVSSVFYFNLLVGAAVAGLLALAAPAIAHFYSQPLLTPLTRLLSRVLVINGLGLVQASLMRKQLEFRRLTLVSLTAALVSGALAITLALTGWGVWSLAVQQIASATLQAAALWLVSPWRPTAELSLASLRNLLGFGSQMLASGLLNTLFENLYLVVIGRVFAAADLGFYARARQLEQLPSTSVSAIVDRVTFPVFATVQDDTARLKRGMRQALAASALLNFPMLIGLAVTARPLVVTLLTEKWLPCVPYLQLLCIAGLLYPIHSINLNLLMAKGRADLFFRLEVVKKLLVVLNLLIAWQWGIEAIIVGQILLSVIAAWLNSYFTARLIDYPLRQQIGDLAPYLLMSLTMGAAVAGAYWLPLTTEWLLLTVQLPMGIAVYALLCMLLRPPAATEAFDLLRGKLLTGRAT